MKYEPLVEDSYFHIYNCGNNKENIFLEDKNYTYFLSLLKKYIVPTSNIMAYCLLKNHFHLLVKTRENIEEKKISQSFSNFFNSYSKSINKSYGRSGSLFKDRFSRIKVDNEDYLKRLIIYIHLNPEHHAFVSDFKLYKHSSFLSLISSKPTLLLRKEVISLFEDKDNFIASHFIKQQELEKIFLLE